MVLHGKNVLITGAARRIGRETALTLAQSGARILIHYNRSRSEAEVLRSQIVRSGGKALLFHADFSKTKNLSAEIKKFAGAIYRKAGNVDVLVNNASIFYPTPIQKMTEKDWDAFLTVNLKSPFLLSREIGLRMKRQKTGKIINLIDSAAERPSADFLPYGISKAGLLAATRGLAKALAPYVQVNGIGPGPILPPEFARGKKAAVKAAASKTLLKRFGNPRDIAQTVKYLAESTEFVTGVFLPVDGGASIA